MGRFNGQKTEELQRLAQAESGCIYVTRDTDRYNDYMSSLGPATIEGAQAVLADIFDAGSQLNAVRVNDELPPDYASRALGAMAAKDYGLDVMIIDPIIATYDSGNLDKTKALVRSGYADRALCIIDYAQTNESDLVDENVRRLMLCIAKFSPEYRGQGGTIISVETNESLSLGMLNDIRDEQVDSVYA